MRINVCTSTGTTRVVPVESDELTLSRSLWAGWPIDCRFPVPVVGGRSNKTSGMLNNMNVNWHTYWSKCLIAVECLFHF